MQFRTKLGLVDIPNEEVLSAARDIAGSELSPYEIAASLGSLGVGGGSKRPSLGATKTEASTCKLCEIFGEGPCSPKCLEAAQEKVARAIHAEHNAHEGLSTTWIELHCFQRDKYRGKAYAAMLALGAPKKVPSRRSNDQTEGTRQ